MFTYALIANATRDEQGNLVDKGNLKLSTDTLIVADLFDTDTSKDTSFNLNITHNLTCEPKTGNLPPAPLTGSTTLGGSNNGYQKAQTTKATLGNGQLVVGGAEPATVDGLNRDINQSQEITRDIETGGLDASVTIDHRWLTEGGRDSIAKDVKDMGKNTQYAAKVTGQGVSSSIEAAVSISYEGDEAKTLAAQVENYAGLKGLIPTKLNGGGLVVGQMPVLLGADDIDQRAIVAASKDSQYVKANPLLGWVSIKDTTGFYLLPEEKQKLMANLMVTTATVDINAATATYQNGTNGMLNTEALALYNAMTQTHDVVNGPANQEVKFTLNYNPPRDVIADGLESGLDKLAIWSGNTAFSTSVAVQTGKFLNNVMLARGDLGANVANHSQGNLLTLSGMLAVGVDSRLDFKNDKGEFNFTFNMYGSPVNNEVSAKYLDSKGMVLQSSSVNKGDAVGQTLGGNYGLYTADKKACDQVTVVQSTDKQGVPTLVTVPVISLEDTQKSEMGPQDQAWLGADLYRLFGDDSTHANYSCVGKCGAENPALMTGTTEGAAP